MWHPLSSQKKLNWRKNLRRANLISLLSFIIFGIIASIAVPYFHGKYLSPYHIEDLRRHVVFNSFINLSIHVIILSIYYSLYLVKYWEISIENEEELKRENLIAKYEALKSQVNPHFLFNSLNTLTGIVEQDSKKAVDYIKHLSNTYRYVLEQRDKELVTIEEELKFVDDYIFLAKLRHGEGLVYNVSIASRQKKIVPLGLQILIENCIKHNVIEDDLPLKIELFEEESYLVVKNNFQKKRTISKQEKIGLDNLSSRYTFLTSRPVLIEEEATQFVVKIPIIENSQI